MRNFARSIHFTRLPSLLGAAALAAAAMILSGCEVTETTQTYASGPVCPQIYDPVCAERRGDERTFPNACEARTAGWRIVADGQCRADYSRDYRDRDYRDRDYRSRDYKRSSGSNRYDNQRSKDRRPVQPATPVRPAKPARTAPPVRQSTPVKPKLPAGACPQVFEQVCGQLNNATQRYMNRCELLRAGAVEVPAGMCMGGNR